MRALVLSGGGSKGAFGGGIAEYLVKDLGIKYDIFVGTSTGSLLLPFIAANEIDIIRHAYTHVGQGDIFSNCPFFVKKLGPGQFKSSFNHLGIILQFLKGKKTFGESKALKKLIRTTLTEEIFNRIKASPNYAIVTVSNLSYNIVEYKYARDCTYEEFCDWIWISCNLVPFMSLAIRNECEYADGGFGDIIPIQEAINLGAKIIDVIVLNPRHHWEKTTPATNALNLLMKGYDFMLHQIGQDDINLSLLESRFENVSVRLIHTPRKLTDNSFIFDKELMTAWWKEGHEYAKKAYPWRDHEKTLNTDKR